MLDLIKTTLDVKWRSVESLMTSGQVIFDDGVYQEILSSIISLKMSSPRWSVESKTNQAMELEAMWKSGSDQRIINI